ncbi:MAG: group II intron reverse transcriptase/maturase [Planctomycetota bacterium]|nr:MAG: group II intron reverse transcriptase/maturase [Planctomycetota bacterium]
MRNGRGPTRRPTSGRSDPYESKVKWGRAGRESEGRRVPARPGETREEGRSPASVVLDPGERCEGVPFCERAWRSKNPKKFKVPRLQDRLFVAAKANSKRRFHALYDRIYRADVLRAAWNRVRSNKGAAGVDGVRLADVERRGVWEFLRELQEDLQAGSYRPKPVLRRSIPKAGGKQRPLGIPTVRDRVVQQAARIVLEPIFEADFKDCSYGFRPGRCATDAKERIRWVGGRGHRFVIDGDIRSFFDTIDHDVLLDRLRLRISDRRVLKRIRLWLQAGVLEDGRVSRTSLGTPQGGVISPLLANVYLNYLDTIWEEHCSHLGVLVRYADDFVVLCRRRSQANEALRRLKGIEDPNPVLRGWGNYFRTGNASDKFNQIDTYVWKRLIRSVIRRGGQRRKKVKGRRFHPKERPHARCGEEHGFYKLLGTIRCPGRTNAA